MIAGKIKSRPFFIVSTFWGSLHGLPFFISKFKYTKQLWVSNCHYKTLYSEKIDIFASLWYT